MRSDRPSIPELARLRLERAEEGERRWEERREIGERKAGQGHLVPHTDWLIHYQVEEDVSNE